MIPVPQGNQIKVFFANFGRKKNQLLNMLSISLNILILFYYVPGECTFCNAQFSGNNFAFRLFVVLAPLHVLICTLGFGSWLTVRWGGCGFPSESAVRARQFQSTLIKTVQMISSKKRTRSIRSAIMMYYSTFTSPINLS
jgi:hypothetical protein